LSWDAVSRGWDLLQEETRSSGTDVGAGILNGAPQGHRAGQETDATAGAHGKDSLGAVRLDRPATHDGATMKGVCIFIPSLRGGGTERVMLRLATAIHEAGHKTDLVLASAEGPYLSQVPPKLSVIDLGSRRVRGTLFALTRYLLRAQPEAILTAMAHCNAVALLAKKIARSKARIVVSQRQNLSASIAKSGKVKRWIEVAIIRFVYSKADAIVANSQGVANDLCALTGLPPSRVTVIPNPVAFEILETLASDPVDHPWIRQHDLPVILAVGRLTEQKDFATLLRAFSKVLPERPARLIILGEGEDRDELEELCRELGISDNVAFPGFQQNVYAWMAKSDLVVLSSKYEGSPNVLVEAMALKRPVVATDCPSGPREVLDGGRLGPLVPVGDSLALAKAIIATLSSPVVSGDWLRKRVLSFALPVVTRQYCRILGIDESQQ